MHTKHPPEVSIVLPCLNEVETLPASIRQINETLDRHGIRGEIIVADNRSSDGTGMVAGHMGAHVVRVPERGYGNAIQGGVRHATAPFIIMGDPDGSYDFSYIPQFVRELKNGYDLVVGNRFKGGIRAGAMSPLHFVGNRILTGMGNALFHTKALDHHCGIRAFTKSALSRMHIHTSHFAFAPEMIIRATLMGMRVKEIPVTLRPDRRTRHHTYIHVIRDGLQNLAMMWRCWRIRNRLHRVAC